MSTPNVAEAEYVVMPISGADLNNASSDPLSSPALLRRLYYDYSNHSGNTFHDSHLSDLARNPALPPDVFSALLLKLKEVEDKSSSIPSQSIDMLSNFLLNSLTTFEQVLYVVSNSVHVKNIVDVDKVKSSKTVVEIFDRLVPLANDDHKGFLTRLLCSSWVSNEDFQVRIMDGDVRPKLHEWGLCSSARFTPSDADYEGALAALASFDMATFDDELSIMENPNSTPEFLVQAHGYAAGRESVEMWVYENLNYPIELSASFHIERLSEYKWRPSYLVELEAKVEARLTLISGEGPWEDLPLLWKLEMVRFYKSGK